MLPALPNVCMAVKCTISTINEFFSVQLRSGHHNSFKTHTIGAGYTPGVYELYIIDYQLMITY
jgi:hypothetical protein